MKNHKINCQCSFCKAKRGEFSGKNHWNYIDGRTLKIRYCKCGNRIKDYKAKMCKECILKPENNPMFGKKPKPLSKQAKQNISEAHKNKPLTLKHKKKMRLAKLNKYDGENNPFFGKCHKIKTKKIIGKKSKENWKTKEYREKTIKALLKSLQIQPNKPEQLLNNLLQQILPNEYKYNKTFIIAGLIPDFVNKKEKKIIELYGDYWHNKPKSIKRDKNRVGIYELFAGYQTLIIWEHELKDLEKVIAKVMEFNLN